MAAITDLSTASSVNTSDYLVVSQSGTDKKVTANKFAIVATTNTFAGITSFGETIQVGVGKSVKFDTGTNLWRIQQNVTGATGILTITRDSDADVMTFQANKTVKVADNFQLVAGKSVRFDTGTNLWRMAQDVTGATGVFKITRDSYADVFTLGVDGSAKIYSLTGSGNRAVYSDPNGVLTNTSSDATLKTNVAPIGSREALDLVAALEPVRYNWIDTDKRGEQREIGLIAQQVQPHVPEVVGTNSDGTLSLDYPKLTALLIGAVQELAAKVAALEAAK